MYTSNGTLAEIYAFMVGYDAGAKPGTYEFDDSVRATLNWLSENAQSNQNVVAELLETHGSDAAAIQAIQQYAGTLPIATPNEPTSRRPDNHSWKVKPPSQLGLLHMFGILTMFAAYFWLATNVDPISPLLAIVGPGFGYVVLELGIRVKNEKLSETIIKWSALFLSAWIPFALMAWLYIITTLCLRTFQ